MNIDPLESIEPDNQPGRTEDPALRHLNAAVAVTVAILATFMGTLQSEGRQHRLSAEPGSGRNSQIASRASQIAMRA